MSCSEIAAAAAASHGGLQPPRVLLRKAVGRVKVGRFSAAPTATADEELAPGHEGLFGEDPAGGEDAHQEYHDVAHEQGGEVGGAGALRLVPSLTTVEVVHIVLLPVSALG